MQSKLPPVFGLDQHPIVVPAGQQVGREGYDRGAARVGLRRCRCRVQQSPGEGSYAAEVHDDILGEAKLEPTYLKCRAIAPQAGHGGAQVAVGMALGGVRPQRASDRGPVDDSVVKRQERKQALRSPWNPCLYDPLPPEAESAEHRDHDAVGSYRQGCERSHRSPPCYQLLKREAYGVILIRSIPSSGPQRL